MIMNTIAILAASYLYLGSALIVAIYFFTRPKQVMQRMALCGVIIAPLSYIIAKVASHFYYDPRPFVVDHIMPLIAHAADNGFPSDHMLLASALAMIVWFYNRKLAVILWVLAAVIGWSRVYVGVHHWTDILGSVVIVLIASVVYYFAVPKRFRRVA